MHVCWNEITSDYESSSSSWYGIWPHRGLGPVDGVPASLGKGCELVLDMGEGFEIENNAGNDLTVYERSINLLLLEASCFVIPSSLGISSFVLFPICRFC